LGWPLVHIHVSGNTNVPYKASVFDVAHDHGLSTAFMVGKPSLAICGDSYNATNGGPDFIPPDNDRSKIDTNFLGYYSSSSIIVDYFLHSLTNGTPYNSAFLHVTEPDSIGHSKGWGTSAWFDGLQQVDAQLGRIFAAIETNGNSSISLQTALIITADHGGYGPTHTDPLLEYNYTIPIFVWGPGFPDGTDLYALFANRADPGTNRVDYNSIWQPLRNGDTGNLALSMLGLPPIPGSTLIPLFPTATPALSIRPGVQPVIEWSAAAAQFTLETSPTLGPGANWTAVTTGIVTNSPKFSYSLRAEGSPGFYRLRKSQ
jgi:hypothetical protein